MYKPNARNKKWVGLFLILAISILIAGMNNDVYAVNIGVGADGDTDIACTGYNAELTIKDNDNDSEVDKVIIKPLYGQKYKVIVVSTNEFSDAELVDDSTAQKGKIKQWIREGKGVEISSKYVIDSKQIAQFETKGGEVEFSVVVYASDIPKAKKGERSCSYWYKISHFGSRDEGGEGPIESATYNSKVCQDARNLAAQNSAIATLLHRAMPPCFNTSVVFNMTLSTLEQLYKRIEQFSKVYEKYKQSDAAYIGSLPALDSKWVKVDKTDLTGQYTALGSNDSNMLTCSNKPETTTNYLYYEEKKKKTIDITIGDGMAGQLSKKVDVCTTTCREQLTVTYGPPKAVIAGQCFTYEVEVKSKVTCMVTDINFGDFPSFDGSSGVNGGNGGNGNINISGSGIALISFVPCDIRAVCVNGSGHVASLGYAEQAGPSEDFDECVKACDGGKYTQKCINSCYDKVYNNKEENTSNKNATKQTNTLEISDKDLNRTLYSVDTLNLASKMALTDGGSLSSCPSGLSSDPMADPSVISRVFEYVNQNITGRYYMSGKSILYQPLGNVGCEWNKYGYAYFRDMRITARTVCNAHGYNWHAGSTTCSNEAKATCYATSGCYPGRMGRLSGFSGYYYPSSNGIKRSSKCSEKCSWKNTGHPYNQPDKVCYFLGRGTGTNGGTTGGSETGPNGYLQNVKKYLDALEECISTAVIECDKETTTYKMSVNTDTKTGSTNQICDSSNYNNNSNCLKWNDSHNKTTGFNNLNLTQNSILKYIGGTCAGGSSISNNNEGKNNELKDAMYHTILTFPGAWINNKNGEVVYDNKGINEKWYTSHVGNYCTPLIAVNVNANWWTWYQYYKAGTINKTWEEWAGSNKKDLIYNIFSQVEKFGHYQWKFNAGCYYAINDYTPGVGIPTDPNPPTPKCEFSSGCNSIPPGCVNNKCEPSPKKTTDNDTNQANYTSKSISTSTMFPQTKTSAITTNDTKATKLSYVDKVADTDATTGTRKQGYNWSVEATNLSIKGYPVTPSSLVKKIESTETYTDAEVDYDIYLSKTNIKNIKADSKDNAFSYTSYDGQYKTLNNDYESAYLAVKNADGSSKYSKNDIPTFTYYKSTYIRDSRITSSSHFPSNTGLTCNNLKANGTQCDYLEAYTSADPELISFLGSVNKMN